MKHNKWSFINHPLTKILLVLVGVLYVVYMFNFIPSLFHSSSSTSAIDSYTEGSSASVELNYWNSANMQNASEQDISSINLGDQSQQTTTTVAQKVQVDGSLKDNTNPQVTVGKIFFSVGSQNYVCSGTSVIAANKNSVDTAGHCLYYNGTWSTNVIFCPQYNKGQGPNGCWAGKELFVPKDWENAKSNDLHHDFGLFVVTPNSSGNLADVVGAVGYASGQAADQQFYAYGYPAAGKFDGQTQQSCQDKGKYFANYAGGTVVSIKCDMTGGSSGGGWLVQINGKWYVNGHNDFTSSLYPNNMFSPLYDDTWYAMYQSGQNA
jgi:V8-like Glu-specific endopeptidase